ncbi:MAG: radical SAM protein, partial [Candidatus Hodarchaeota archaeon]
MNAKTYLLELFPKTIHYKLARRGIVDPANPVTLTFSVTAACQSRCKTCHIGTRYHADPQIAKQDLTLDEIEKIFQSLGHVYFLNISGGEPFLRPDLPQIIQLACKYLTPAIVHIPTNALTPQRIARAT